MGKSLSSSLAKFVSSEQMIVPSDNENTTEDQIRSFEEFMNRDKEEREERKSIKKKSKKDDFDDIINRGKDLIDDIMDDDYPMKAIISYDDIVYEGIIHNYESYSNAPHVALGSYVVKDNNGVIKNDYSEDNTRITILDTSKANNVEILYCKDSNECDDLQNLCKFHNIYKDN